MSPRKRKGAQAATTLEQLQASARTLSGMLTAAVEDASRRQREALQQQADPGPQTKEMKELTGILKDITGVVKTLEPTNGEEACSGVVLLPEVKADG